MHLYTRIGLLMALGLVARCSAVLDDISEDRKAALALREGNRIYQEREANREPRRIKGPRTTNLIDELLGIVVDFNSADCDEGECLSAKQCSAAGVTEVPDDRCAGGFGVCCITGEPATEEPATETTVAPEPLLPPPPPYNGATEDDPNVDIPAEGGDFFNEGESIGGSPTPTRNNVRQDVCRTYTAYLFPADDAVQVKVDIRTLNITGPVDGDCGNDTLVFKNANPGLEIPTLCGLSTDQTLFIGIDNAVGLNKSIELNLCNVGYDRSWDIGISFLEEADAVPARCLQYFKETTGTITSFNFEGTPSMKGMMLNNQIYSVCFKYIPEYCDISFNFARFDLGNIGGPRSIGGPRRVTMGPADVDCDDEFVRLGTSKYCGDYIDMMVTANSSTVIGMDVVSSSINEIQVEGFSATYMMVPCP